MDIFVRYLLMDKNAYWYFLFSCFRLIDAEGFLCHAHTSGSCPLVLNNYFYKDHTRDLSKLMFG